MEWLVAENKALFSRFQQQRDKERHGILGKILCSMGLHKNRAYKYQMHKAIDGIMAFNFACIRCSK